MDKTTLEKTTPGGKSANQLVNPPPSGAGPMDSGGGQTLLDGGEEKERTENALQKGSDGENPFKRSNLLHRSPTRTQRTLSLDRTGSSTGRKKRKAEQSPPKTGSSERERETLWLRLVSKVGELRTLVIANPTTKLEIKKNSEDLQSLVTVLSNLEETSDDEDTAEGLRTQNQTSSCSLGTQTEEDNYHTVATQTEGDYTATKEDLPNNGSLTPTVEEIRSKIVEDMDFTQVKQLSAVNWPKNAYRSTTLFKGSIVGGDVDNTRVILANEDVFQGSLLCKNLCSQVPGLKGKSISPGGLLIVESKDLVTATEEEVGETEESRLLVIVGLSPPNQDIDHHDDEDLFSKVKRVRQLVEQRSKNSISLAVPEDADLGRMRKIIECCFAGNQVKVNLRLGKKNKYSTAKTKGSNQTDKSVTDKGVAQKRGTDVDSSKWEVIKNRKKLKKVQRRDDVIVVRQEGKSYSEILKAVKEGLDPTHLPSGARVTSIQKSKKEDLVIRVKGNGRAAETLCKAVKEKLPGFKANVRKEKKVVLHISDLDEDTTREEIRGAIKSELGQMVLNVDDAEVTSLRPAYAGTQKATVKLTQGAAKTLAKKRRILIGWISCRVKMREELQRCYRCWETGHMASACKGPDKSGLCFSCGEEGHQKRSCSKLAKDKELEENSVDVEHTST